MPQYQAIFLAVDGLSETDIDPPYRWKATTRNEAEDEALGLPRPEGANFVKVIREGQDEGPKRGFTL